MKGFEEKFKPCPFCGGKIEILTVNNGSNFIVWCEKCGLGFGIEKEYLSWQILEAWNKRFTNSGQTAEAGKGAWV